MVVCRTAWYVEAPLQRGFGGMHWMEGADPRCLTLVSFKCIIVSRLCDFKKQCAQLCDFVGMYRMSDENLYDSIALAERIKNQAKDRNIQLKEMFDVLALSRNTLSSLRTGRMMAADSLARIADYLDCSMDYLMGRTGDPAAQQVDLTADERQKVNEYVQFLLSQRNPSSGDL